jgi:uncharacterized phage-like protein YoqJ
VTDVTLVVTGHRPPRLGLDYSPESNRVLTEFAQEQLLQFIQLSICKGLRLARVISGMAQGWDQAVAHATLLLEHPLVCALPFDDHGSNWPEEARRRHDAILTRSEEQVVVTPGKFRGGKAYIARDEWMVERAAGDGHGVVMALWDGVESGGTWQTVRYARMRGMTVWSTWAHWGRYRGRGVSGGVTTPPEAPDGTGTSGMGCPPG